VRWKQYHYAFGKALKDVPAESWLFVEKEKNPDMIHVLQFPYNGEPPRVCLTYPFQLFDKITTDFDNL
jgi:sulfite oxidase